MSIAPYLKEIGRGKEGARSLDIAQSHDLMCQVLDRRASDLEIGAFAIAMRIKGETADELTGFLTAVRERCIALADIADLAEGAVVLPSYNGARKLPNLTALLALFLAQEGVPVLVHGATHAGPVASPGTGAPARVTTAEIFHDLGLPVAHNAEGIAHAWSRREPVFIATEALCPPLAALLDVRWAIGLRNPGHTIAKLLDPLPDGRALRVVSYTHPEYGVALADFLQRTGANAMLLRGTEGEPVADPRRLPRIDAFVRGVARADLSLAPQEGVLTELPVLPRHIDAATTALYIQAVVSGEKPAPAPLVRQADAIRRALLDMQHAPAVERTA